MVTQGVMTLKGNIVDVVGRRIFRGEVQVENGIIKAILEKQVAEDHWILPGLIDAHVHIESSMVIPSEFARVAVTHGTVATVSDPHEIANVLGISGVEYMIENGRKVPFKFFFGAPSCVPATPFETAGAVFGLEETEHLLQNTDILYLSEMMNYPGVLFENEEVMGKLALARKYGKVIDGHAPGLKGLDAAKYANAGITTDHECFTHEEAIDKINAGMKILLREGSAAKNFEALIALLDTHPEAIMMCSDDKHPNDLVKGHINEAVKRALALGYYLFDVLRACSLNPVRHYGLPVGLLQLGDPADLIVVNNMKDFEILSTYINGVKVAENGQSLIEPVQGDTPNVFNANKLTTNDLQVPFTGQNIRVQKALDGQLITESFSATPLVEGNNILSDINNDILKILVMNRYQPTPPSIGFINGFGLKQGAIASTVAHDSHNIIAVGTNDADLVQAVNMLIDEKGGISLADGQNKRILPLPVAGIMSAESAWKVAEDYEKLHHGAKNLGSTLFSPFMTLSFMALLVIPALKISDKGLFDGTKFEFTELYMD
jgi:adenine deaminase